MSEFYARIGGVGSVEVRNGGFNGGGNSMISANFEVGSSGGGATDLRAEYDDLYHRIIVAGGGGGADNYYFTDLSDDGAGGAGGYPEGQGYWIEGQYYSELATQSKGASFGNGQSASNQQDTAGGGGGWFGGYSSNNGNGGAGGGSSFIFSKNASIPSSISYAFQKDSRYLMTLIAYENGIWSGSGKLVITEIKDRCSLGFSHFHFHICYFLFMFFYSEI